MKSDAPSPPRRSVVVANAGSGKTWTLANRILAWCLDGQRADGAPDPSRMLAVTFTRKAAGEILARILTHAAQGAEDSEAGQKAREDFASIIGPASADEYRSVLAALCAALPRMQVGTIDGFFHRVALAMPDEVGLPGDWNVGDDHELAELRAQAAARVLEGEEAARLVTLLEDGAPKASALRAIEALLGGGAVAVLDHYRATIARDAGGAATHAQDDAAVRARLDRVWGWVARLPLPGDVVGERGTRNLEELVRRWKGLRIPMNGVGKPRVAWARMHAKVLALLETRNFRALAAETAVVNISTGGSYSSFPPPPEWFDAVVALVPHLRAALVRDLAGRIEGALGVLPAADVALGELQAERGVFSFSDVGRGVARAAVRPGSRVASVDALRSALGRDLADLAIDEAQDTSAEQFAALRPLLERVLGSGADSGAGGRLLMVGDPKQAIYGWRGGTPGLVDRIRSTYADSLSPDAPLTKSYRSSPILMDFVNRVLGHLGDDLPALVEDQEVLRPLSGVADFIAREGLLDSTARSAFGRAAEEWVFTPHEAANRSLAGTITAYACGDPAEEDDDEGDDEDAGSGARDPVIVDAGTGRTDSEGDEEVAVEESVSPAERAAMVAATLHARHPDRTIGILVRTNRAATETTDALKRLGAPASDEGRGTLLDSPAVVGVVSLLQLVDDPGDRIAHFLVSRGPMAVVTGLAPLEHAGSQDAAHAAAADYARRMRDRIADEGLSAVLSGAVRALAAQGLAPRDRGRLERMVAIAGDFERAPVARISEFIDALAADAADASSADRIRVMTIHASKGLEFDEVVLPAVNETWGDVPKDWATLMLDPADPPRLVAPLCNSDVRRWIPELSILERDARRRRLLDDLSLFYVAVTRAKRGLHLVVDVKQRESLPTGARLVMRALARPVAAPDALSGAPDFAAAFEQARHDDVEPFWEWSFGPAETTDVEAERGKRVGRIETMSGDANTAGADAGEAGGDTDSMDASGSAEAMANDRLEPLVEIVARRTGRAAPPSHHAPTARSLWAFDPFSDDDSALRGVLVHECFRAIRAIDDLVAASRGDRLGELVAAAATRAAVEKGAPIPDLMQEGVAKMLVRVANGAGARGSIGDRLSVGPNDEVRNEFAYLRAADGVASGRIDRLVLHRSADGEVRGATILDYKTGAEGRSRAALQPTLAGYVDQMRGYCAAVEDLWRLPMGSARAALLFVDRDEVIDVDRVADVVDHLDASRLAEETR